MNRIRKFFAGLLALIMPLAGGCARANQSDGQTGFEMHVIDVGKADCILIKCDGEYMLVDTGLKDSEDAIRAYLKAQNVTEFNYVVATHPDKDHIGGMKPSSALSSSCTKPSSPSLIISLTTVSYSSLLSLRLSSW